MIQRPSPKIPANSMIPGDRGGRGVPVLTGKYFGLNSKTKRTRNDHDHTFWRASASANQPRHNSSAGMAGEIWRDKGCEDSTVVARSGFFAAEKGNRRLSVL